jgi:uncharacterized protein
MDEVRIRYVRPPDRTDIFVQDLVLATRDVRITLLEHTPRTTPIRVDSRVILEDGSPIVWFTFPGEWHDVGRFHDAAGTFTGYYANVLTPPRFTTPTEWETTDLFLDVWLDANGKALLLDADEFAEALAAGWIDRPTARRARREAGSLLSAATLGTWPPRIVRDWTLQRARAALARPDPAAPPETTGGGQGVEPRAMERDRRQDYGE